MQKKIMGYRNQIIQYELSKTLIAYELGITRGALDRWLLKDEAGRLEDYKSFCLYTIINNLIGRQVKGDVTGHSSALWG